MESYDLTLRFNDNEKTLSAKNGLPINQLGELLTYLGKAVDLKDNLLTLSEIKGNCYAVTISTPKLSLYNTLRSIHSCISEGDLNSLTIEQVKYANRLNSILDNKYTLDVYDIGKTFNYKITNVVPEKKVEYYYEIDEIYGIISSIGGNTLESKQHIKLSNLNYEISVSESQEKNLLKYFKNKRILFKINKKIDFETDRILSAELLEYETPNKNKMRFIDSANNILNKRKGHSLFPKIKDSVESIRTLRGEIKNSCE